MADIDHRAGEYKMVEHPKIPPRPANQKVCPGKGRHARGAPQRRPPRPMRTIWIVLGVTVGLLIAAGAIFGILHFFVFVNEPVVGSEHGGTNSPYTKAPLKTQGTTPGSCNSCPEGWHRFEKRCYHVNNSDANSWTKSSEFCTSKKAHLAVVGNTEELESIRQLMEEQTLYWMGLTGENQENNWLWVNKQALDDSLFNFEKKAGKFCLSLTKTSAQMSKCENKFMWICQRLCLAS
ncbi:natural killer cells antigen CD94-like isoform X1 [Polypterus senegalus]|uniref:natural killer cells antigen CD94-like isoform X1 n=1 Tax=Polypterus senegalus TaxID=55291 RepID=UPI00196245DD|nr:natural killer cells antigen CD94-like isoform X1 [Polypterus senegalus]